MTSLYIQFSGVDFRYPSSNEYLFQGLNLHISSGWWGVVGANGSGKSTFLKLMAGILKPTGGHIDKPVLVEYCPQRTDHAPIGLEDFLNDPGKEANTLKGKLRIETDWAERWQHLSHGERKRVQIAVSQWRAPDVLAIDEPTNHVDADARKLLEASLHAFPGIGLIVSHDRELLDALCTHCLFAEPPRMIVRPGGYSQGKDLSVRESESRQHEYSVKKQTVRKLSREAGKRRDQANKADRRRSKRGIAKKDSDARAKIDLVRLSGKDATGGRLLRQMDKRLVRAQEELNRIDIKKEYDMGIRLSGSVSKRDYLLQIPEGTLPLGGEKYLCHPALGIHPEDRIALTGANGTGKSSLLKHILPKLNVPLKNTTYVPQEIDVGLSRQIIHDIKVLSGNRKGHLMTIVSCLGSRPGRLLESTTPSPGEIRKLLLALGMNNEPQIILMDEPTNHMDLPSIECLEKALAACPCGLFLISHDQRFLEALTDQSWHIEQDKKGRCHLKII